MKIIIRSVSTELNFLHSENLVSDQTIPLHGQIKIDCTILNGSTFLPNKAYICTLYLFCTIQLLYAIFSFITFFVELLLLTLLFNEKKVSLGHKYAKASLPIMAPNLIKYTTYMHHRQICMPWLRDLIKQCILQVCPSSGRASQLGQTVSDLGFSKFDSLVALSDSSFKLKKN